MLFIIKNIFNDLNKHPKENIKLMEEPEKMKRSEIE